MRKTLFQNFRSYLLIEWKACITLSGKFKLRILVDIETEKSRRKYINSIKFPRKRSTFFFCLFLAQRNLLNRKREKTRRVFPLLFKIIDRNTHIIKPANRLH